MSANPGAVCISACPSSQSAGALLAVINAPDLTPVLIYQPDLEGSQRTESTSLSGILQGNCHRMESCGLASANHQLSGVLGGSACDLLVWLVWLACCLRRFQGGELLSLLLLLVSTCWLSALVVGSNNFHCVSKEVGFCLRKSLSLLYV